MLENYKETVIERWSPLVRAADIDKDDQKYILSQLLENVQREYGDKETSVKDMCIIIPLTCRIFELIKDDLPKTYPMVGPIDKREEKIIEAKTRKLKNGKFSLELINEVEYNGDDIIDTVIEALYEDIANEIKEECLNDETFHPYILVAPSNKGIYQLNTIYGEVVA